MAVVHENECLVAVREVADLGQRGDVSVHREDAVGGDESASGPGVARRLQLCFEILHVGVLVAVALGLAETHAVDDGSVVQSVGDDGVLLAQERLEDASVGVEAGGVQDGVVGAEEARDLGFELLVDPLRAADEAHRREAVPPLVETGVGRRQDFRMARQPEVIVGAEVQDGAPADADLRTLW